MQVGQDLKPRGQSWHFYSPAATLIHKDLCPFGEALSQNKISHLQCEKHNGQMFSLVAMFSFAF